MSASASLLFAVVFLLFQLKFGEPQCNRKPVIFNFGDSNSDTGGFAAAKGLELAYALDGRPYLTGRPCDGRQVVDYMCEKLKINYLSPYLKSLGSDFWNGVNFAISGSATSDSPFSLDVQIKQFKRFRNQSTLLHFQGYQNNLVGEDDFKNGLYMFDIGQNDLARLIKIYSYDQIIQQIRSSISNIEKAMWAVYEEGGRKFRVHNTGPLGCLPKPLTKLKPNASQVDEHGCIIRLNNAAKLFNSQLKDLCSKLRHEMNASTIVYVDVYSIKYGLIANHSSYGFKNPLMACCGYGGPPYNYDEANECGGAGSSAGVCDQGAEPHINWDGVHYTEAANAVVAKAIFSTEYSTPPLEFNFFCENA